LMGIGNITFFDKKILGTHPEIRLNEVLASVGSYRQLFSYPMRYVCVGIILMHHVKAGTILKETSFPLSNSTPKIVIMRATLKHVASSDVSA